MLNHKSTRSARLFWLGALLGAAVFLLVYGLAPLDAANDASAAAATLKRTSSSTTRAGCSTEAVRRAGRSA